MKDFINKIIHTFLSPKFLGFCVTGTINTFNAAFFSWLAHYILQPNIAAVVGYIISLTIGFFLNSKVVFKSQPSFRKYLRFLLAYVPNFIIYFLVTFITINTLKLSQFWATVLAAMAGGPVTFVIIKLYAFNNNKK